MRFILLNISFVVLTLTSCKESDNKKNIPPTFDASPKFQLEHQDIIQDTTINQEHFRGLNFSNGIYYIAGSKGSIIQYDPKEALVYFDTLHFPYHYRDIQFMDNKLFLLSIQEPAALIIKTENQGISINEEKDSTAFLDGMDFWKNGKGILFGDPINGYPYIVKVSTEETWERVSEQNIPQAIQGEAGFAASGTSIVCKEDGIGYIGWGGKEVRVFKTIDYGNSWISQSTPMPQNQTGTGIYSMAFKDADNGVAVGGNWEFPDCDSSKIYTEDGGSTWHLSSGVQGYRSCVTYIGDNIYVSTGSNGTDISVDGGKTWELLDTLGFNAIDFSEITSTEMKGIGVGNYGLVKTVQLKKK